MILFFIKLFELIKEDEFANKLANFVKSQNVKTAVKIMSIITGFTAFFSILWFIIYGLGYCFMYGFYFGSKDGKLPSPLDILTSAVPFNLYTVGIIGLVFLLATVYFYYLIRVFGKFDWESSFLAVITIFLFHITISSVFFSRDNSGSLFMELAPFWLSPLEWAIFITWYYFLLRGLLVTLSSTLLLLMVELIGAKVLGLHIENVTALFISAFALSIVSRFILMRVSKPIFYMVMLYPFLLIGILTGIYQGQKYILLWQNRYAFWVGIMISIVGSYKFSKVPSISRIIEKVTRDKFLLGQLSPMLRKPFVLNLSFVLVLLVIFTYLPNMMLASGKELRTLLPEAEKEYLTFSNSNIELEGKVIAERNGIFYISDKNQELVIVKSDDFSSCPPRERDVCKKTTK